MRTFKRLSTALVLAMVYAMLWTLGEVAAAPLAVLNRAQRREAGIRLVRYPKPVSKAYLWLRKRTRALRIRVKYDLIEASAALLSLYCWATRQQGFEGLRMSYWRWLATIHLAL